jgi:hypothetical protein
MANGDALPLSCPRCSKTLVFVARGIANDLMYYVCATHGRFWIDDEGRLRESFTRTDDHSSDSAIRLE